MKKKIKLHRYQDGGSYQIYYDKEWEPLFFPSTLCLELTKEWLGLKHHLRKEQTIQGYLEVKFTPIKGKK